MSLWFESFAESLDDCGDNPEKRALCIVRYLSMPVPRLWWENALAKGIVDDSYLNIIEGCYRDLIELSGMPEAITYGTLIALPFTESNSEAKDAVATQIYLQKHFSEANSILSKRPDLRQLANKIETNANNRLAQS